MEFARERAAADFFRRNSTVEQHQRSWPQRQTHPELPLQAKALQEQQDRVDEQRDRKPQQEKRWQQQAAQGEHLEQRKLLQPFKVLQEARPLVQVQNVGQARQPQEEHPAEQQRLTVLRGNWEEPHFRRVEEAEPASESPARRGLALQGTPPLPIVHLHHQPGSEEDCLCTLRQQRAPYEVPCRHVCQQESEVKQHPGPQQQQLQQEPQVQLLPEPQQKWQSLSLAERKSGFSEFKCEQHFHEERQKNVGREQRAAQPGTEHDSGGSLEDVLAAVADAEKVAQGSDSPPNSGCGGQTTCDEQKGHQSEPPQLELELHRQQHQEWPQGEQRQQEHQRQHPGERRPHEQAQKEQEREAQPRTVKMQLEDSEGKEQACALPLTIDQELSELPQGVRALQVDIRRQREPPQGENWMVHRQQYSAEAQQLTWQQPYEGLPTEVQRRQAGATEHRGEKLDRNVAIFGEDPLQEISQSAHRQREGDECASEMDQKSIQAVDPQKRQPQECGAGETTETLQRLATESKTAEVELEEEVCDFLEADLPPAAVVRWSDYLRLREQQQQQCHHWRQLQQEERQRYRQQCTTSLPFTQNAVSFKMAAYPVPPGELSSRGRTRIEGSSSIAGCSSSSESVSGARRSPVRQAVDRRYRGLSSCTSPQSTFRTTSQVLTSHRSVHAPALASTTCSSTSDLRLSGASSVNDPASSAELSVSSRIGGTSSGSAGGSSGSSTAKFGTVTSSTPARWTSSTSGRSNTSSASARGMNESTSRFCDTSAAAVRAPFSPTNHSQLPPVKGGSVPTLAVHVHRSRREHTVVGSALASAPPSYKTPLSPSGNHSRDLVQHPAASAPAAQSSPSSPATHPGPTLAALSPSRSSGSGFARMNCQALLSAAHEQSQKRRNLPLARAATACALPGAPSSLASASTSPAPGGLHLLAAPAARRGDGDTSSTTRRPVSLEAFFHLRDNRPRDARSGCSRPLSPNQAVAVPPLCAVESGIVSDYSSVPCPATVTLSRTPERCSEDDAAASTGASTTSPSAIATSPAARPAGASTVDSSVRGVSFAAADQIAGGPRSVLEGNAPYSGPQPISLASVRAPDTGSASQDVRVAERGNTAAREPLQTHFESSVATAEDQVEVEALLHPSSHKPLQKIVEGVKRRRGSGIAAYGCGNTRKFIYLKTHEECIVCFVEIRVKGEFAMVADCRHCFCCACLARWIKKSKTCPLCRRPVTTVELWRQTPGVLTKNPLAYAFLRRLRPDKNNILKPVAIPRRRAGVQQGPANNRAKAAPSNRVGVDAASITYASGGEERALGL